MLNCPSYCIMVRAETTSYKRHFCSRYNQHFGRCRLEEGLSQAGIGNWIATSFRPLIPSGEWKDLFFHAGMNFLGSVEAGKDPLISKLMKGIYNKRPLSPKYTSTWDPSIVLAHFDSTAASTPSLIQLSRKTATLLAPTSFSRCTELASIELSSIDFSEGIASFFLDKPKKAQYSGPLHRCVIESWPQNPSICPVFSLRAYVQRTAAFRVEGNKKTLGL